MGIPPEDSSSARNDFSSWLEVEDDWKECIPRKHSLSLSPHGVYLEAMRPHMSSCPGPQSHQHQADDPNLPQDSTSLCNMLGKGAKNPTNQRLPQ